MSCLCFCPLCLCWVRSFPFDLMRGRELGLGYLLQNDLGAEFLMRLATSIIYSIRPLGIFGVACSKSVIIDYR